MDDLHALARQTTADAPLRLAVASAGEAHIIEAVRDATEAGYVTPVLFGDKTVITELCEEHGLALDKVSVQHTDSRLEAGKQAVQAVSQGECDLLMKGYIQTAALMREVLNKEYGLRSGRKLSHALVFDAPHYDKLFIMSDGALNIEPDLPLKLEIVNNAIQRRPRARHQTAQGRAARRHRNGRHGAAVKRRHGDHCQDGRPGADKKRPGGRSP